MDLGFSLKALIRKIFTNTCIFFTVITAVYAIVVAAVYVDDDEVLLDAGRVILFFVFSFMFSVANGILRITALPMWARTVIHFPITAAAFYICFLMPINPTPSNTIVGMSVFTVVYCVVFAIAALVRSRYKSLGAKEEAYKAQYAKKDIKR